MVNHTPLIDGNCQIIILLIYLVNLKLSVPLVSIHNELWSSVASDQYGSNVLSNVIIPINNQVRSSIVGSIANNAELIKKWIWIELFVTRDHCIE